MENLTNETLNKKVNYFGKIENAIKKLTLSKLKLEFKEDNCIAVSFLMKENFYNIILDDHIEDENYFYSIVKSKHFKNTYMFYIRSEKSLDFLLRILNSLK